MVVVGAAKRYAQAAFDIAKQQGDFDQWERDLQQLVDVLHGPAVSEFFQSPAVPLEAKQRAIEAALPEPSQRYIRNLALVLLERGRFEQVPQVVEYFHDLVLIARGVAIADVTTAVELQPAEAREVRERLSQLTGKKVELRPRVDPAIIGGIVVRIGDELIDGSVRTQLTTLRQRMVS